MVENNFKFSLEWIKSCTTVPEYTTERKLYGFERKQRLFSNCLNPTISMLKSSPLKFPSLDPIFSRSVLNSRSVQDVVSAC